MRYLDYLSVTQMTESTLTELYQKIHAGVRIAIAEAMERHRLGESISILKDG